MAEFHSIETLAREMQSKLDAPTVNKKIVAIFAFNATGKTRLTNLLSEMIDASTPENEEIKVLCYNAFLEDVFKWDNEEYILTFDPSSWFVRLVNEQGIEKDIIDNFKDIVGSNIEPLFNFPEGKVTFNIVSGDDDVQANIKISKSEESMLIWSVFYSIFEIAIDALNTNVDNRTTSIFNDLQYVVVDDPVSSIDDTTIIKMAIKLVNGIQSSQSKSVKFLITTHHALFHNILVNSFKRIEGCNFKSFSLSKNRQMFKLLDQDDSPFSYHLSVKELIQDAIANDCIEKYHYNLFRNLLEKTSNFLGYSNWSDCISGENRQEFIRLLNLYSHSKLSDLESRELSIQDKDVFRDTFGAFVQDFKWK